MPKPQTGQFSPHPGHEIGILWKLNRNRHRFGLARHDGLNQIGYADVPYEELAGNKRQVAGPEGARSVMGGHFQRASWKGRVPGQVA